MVVPKKLYHNNGYKFILILIDILTRYAWTYPLKSLTGKEMTRALKSTITDKVPQKIRTDSGSEFANSQVKRYLKLKGIDIFHTLNEKKANYAERLIQTIKTKITKYLQHAKTFNWVKILSKITESYNLGYHRSIKMSPADAMRTDDAKLWIAQYAPKPRPKKKKASIKPSKQRHKFKLGDKVKLTFNRLTFDRAYDEKLTDENFIVTGRVTKQGISLYTVKDFDNDPIKGSFYESEMQKINATDDVNKVYNIEKIIKKRTRNGKRVIR